MKCEDKEKFSKGQAEHVRKAVRRTHKTIRQRIYHCPHCHFYHLTTVPTQPDQRGTPYKRTKYAQSNS